MTSYLESHRRVIWVVGLDQAVCRKTTWHWCFSSVLSGCAGVVRASRPHSH